MIEEYLKYNPETGELTWIKNSGRKNYLGKIAGTLTKTGYLQISLFKKSYLAHRVAWYLHNHEWPVGFVDHINRIKTDNRIENLRDVTHRQNCHNTESFNDGAQHMSNGKWRSRISINGRLVSLGCYNEEQDAKSAYAKRLEELGESVCDK